MGPLDTSLTLSRLQDGDVVSARLATSNNPQQDAVVHVALSDDGTATLPEGTFAVQWVRFEAGKPKEVGPWSYIGPEAATCTALRATGRLDPWFAEHERSLHAADVTRQHLILITQGGFQRLVPPGFGVMGCPRQGLVRVALMDDDLVVAPIPVRVVPLPAAAWGLSRA
jgi:hypothetical protein